MQRPRKNGARRAVVAAFAMLSGACASSEPPGVQTQSIDTDVAFTTAEVAATRVAMPANAGPVPDSFVLPPQLALPQAFAPAPIEEPSTTTTTTARSRNPVRPACPTAPSATAAAPAPATVPPDVLPATGFYTWRRSGHVTGADGKQVAVSGTEPRAISRAERISPDEFTYDVAQFDLLSPDVIVTTYRVKRAPVSEPLDPPTGGQLTVGEPQRGLSIDAIRRFDRQGTLRTAYRPVGGLLLLPLGVRPGERFTSVGSDPVSGQVGRFDATVIGRDRVDACGEVVDAWVVDATESYDGTVASQRTRRLAIATQLGAVIVAEKTSGTDQGGTVDLTFTISNVQPNASGSTP